MVVLRCRKCHLIFLVNDLPLLTCHNVKMENESLHDPSSETDCRDNIDSVYLQERGLPREILTLIIEVDWKGKFNCPGCGTRLGSFDFISGRKCHCNKSVLPPVHFIHSKVDYQFVESLRDK